MATFTKTNAGTWKAEIRRKGWPKVYKNFRTKRDAEDWARAKEDEMVRGSFITRDKSENTSVRSAFDRYVKEVVPTKKESSRRREIGRAKFLSERLGQYSLATLNSEIISDFRDKRLSEGKSNNTVRLELALLSHLYSVSIKEWGIGLTVNPVLNVRKPSPGKGRERRLKKDEEERLLRAARQQSNPFVGWIIRLALHTAMRKGEIVSLVMDSVDMNKKTIFIRDTASLEKMGKNLNPISLIKLGSEPYKLQKWMIFVSMTCATKQQAGSWKRASLINRLHPSLDILRCRCSSAIPIYEAKT